MAKYLLELGVEELPYSLIGSLLEQIKNNLKDNLQEANAAFSNITTYSTPRRLVFVIDGLNEVQADVEKVHRGPSVKVAVDLNGNYTQAALGFAKKFNADVNDLHSVMENGQEYVALKVLVKGRTIKEIISDIVAKCVLEVQGSHFMRWSNFDEKFSRPIRWIVSILDNEELPIEITGIKSSKRSRAHRFCAEKYPEITDVDSYVDIMLQHNVIVDETEREARVVKSAQELAASIGAEVKIEPELLKEVVNIIEYPKAVMGTFDEKYLNIPEAVIVTVMASHQRYFPVYSKDGQLLNHFITVANYLGEELSNIQNGNERVIKARLDDAIFFYNEDIKKTLESRVELLDGMTFQKGLGSMKDKVERVSKISAEILTLFGYDKYDEVARNTMRAAMLCKADLTTSLVFEFTELQGVIGSYYAKFFNEKEVVAEAIKEHYYPFNADSELASTVEGQIVGIADKLDTICGVFVLNKIPSGSADPLGVRRAAIGIIQTIIKKRLKINLLNLIDYVLSLYGEKVTEPEKIKKEIAVFFTQRFRGIFASQYAPDVIEAVLCTRKTLQYLADVVEKLDLVKEVYEEEDFDKIINAQTRISKILKGVTVVQDPDEFTKSVPDILAQDRASLISQDNRSRKDVVLKMTRANVVQEDLFENEAEDNLYRKVLEIAAKKTSPRGLFDVLVTLVPFIDEFFANVMVMHENVLIKHNRLRLLELVNSEFLKIADFSKIRKNV